MSIQQGLCTIFKQNCLSGLENFAPGTPYTYNIALYTSLANISYSTLAYTSVGEVVGTGYTAGGQALTIIPPASSGQTAYVSFENAVWNPANFICNGALIYNATTGAAVAVLDFGGPKQAQNTFTVTFPTATASTAVIRFS